MRRGIGRLRAGGSGVDSDAAAWAAAVTAAGGTYSASTLAAVSAFSKSAKANGYWTKLNRINLICGDQLTAARVPLKVGGGNTIDTNVSFVSGNYTEATGLTGNTTTKFLRTGLIPSTSLTLNDTHMAVYNRDSVISGGAAAVHIGTRGSPDFMELQAPETDGRVYSRQYDDVNGRVSTTSISTPYGFLVASRNGAGSHVIYRNATSLASNATSGGSLLGTELYVFATNNVGSAFFFASNPLSGYSIGSGLSAGDVTAYNADMQTFQTALGRNV